MFERARPAVKELGAAIGLARNERQRPAGVVGVHSFRTGAELLVRPIPRSFHDAYPDIVLDITLYDAVVDFVAAGYDAAIRIGEVSRAGYDCGEAWS
jgi:DNA-binding transcriptional LysR family regulator